MCLLHVALFTCQILPKVEVSFTEHHSDQIGHQWLKVGDETKSGKPFRNVNISSVWLTVCEQVRGRGELSHLPLFAVSLGSRRFSLNEWVCLHCNLLTSQGYRPFVCPEERCVRTTLHVTPFWHNHLGRKLFIENLVPLLSPVPLRNFRSTEERVDKHPNLVKAALCGVIQFACMALLPFNFGVCGTGRKPSWCSASNTRRKKSEKKIHLKALSWTFCCAEKHFLDSNFKKKK